MNILASAEVDLVKKSLTKMWFFPTRALYFQVCPLSALLGFFFQLSVVLENRFSMSVPNWLLPPFTLSKEIFKQSWKRTRFSYFASNHYIVALRALSGSKVCKWCTGYGMTCIPTRLRFIPNNISPFCVRCKERNGALIADRELAFLCRKNCHLWSYVASGQDMGTIDKVWWPLCQNFNTFFAESPVPLQFTPVLGILVGVVVTLMLVAFVILLVLRWVQADLIEIRGL